MSPDNRNRKADIVAVARAMASTDGMSALTVRAVSAAAGIGVGTLRHHFPTQRALVDAVVADMVGGLLDESVVLDRTRPPGDRLAHAVLQFLPASLTERGQRDAWFAFYVSSLSAPSGQARAVLEASVATSHEHMRRWLGALAADGAIAAKSVDDTSTALIALVNGLTLEALTPGSPVTVEDARRIAESAARAAVTEVVT